MITYTISGPRDAVAKAASRLASMHMVEGKVVAKFDDAAAMPQEYEAPPHVGVVIICKPEK